MIVKDLTVIATVLLVTSCASILSGTKQILHINSTPTGARCILLRDANKDEKDIIIATIEKTPTEIQVEKSKYSITAKCTLKGYKQGSIILESGNEGSTMGNIILGGGVGWAVDSARGADNKYPTYTNVPLTKK
jgi:hypothetical protein